MDNQLNSKLKSATTPSCQLLEENLQELHIERQAYHGGSFVGNHIHKMLEVNTACIEQCYFQLKGIEEPQIIIEVLNTQAVKLDTTNGYHVCSLKMFFPG